MNLTGQMGELTFTVTITRKETGAVEEYQLTSKVTEEQAAALGLNKEAEDDKRSNP